MRRRNASSLMVRDSERIRAVENAAAMKDVEVFHRKGFGGRGHFVFQQNQRLHVDGSGKRRDLRAPCLYAVEIDLREYHQEVHVRSGAHPAFGCGAEQQDRLQRIAESLQAPGFEFSSASATSAGRSLPHTSRFVAAIHPPGSAVYNMLMMCRWIAALLLALGSSTSLAGNDDLVAVVDLKFLKETEQVVAFIVF